MSVSGEVEVKKSAVALLVPMSLEQFAELDTTTQLYAVYRSNVEMQNKMIELENQASALSDPDALMGLATKFLGGGL